MSMSMPSQGWTKVLAKALASAPCEVDREIDERRVADVRRISGRRGVLESHFEFERVADQDIARHIRQERRAGV